MDDSKRVGVKGQGLSHLINGAGLDEYPAPHVALQVLAIVGGAREEETVVSQVLHRAGVDGKTAVASGHRCAAPGQDRAVRSHTVSAVLAEERSI